MIWGLVLKAQYYLANGGQFGVSQLKPSFFPGFIDSKRKKRGSSLNSTSEKYVVSAEVLVEEPINEAIAGQEKDTSMTRWMLYTGLEEFAKQ